MTFTSAVLGEVQHPTNIIREYLEKFRVTHQMQSTHSILARRMDTNEVKAGKTSLGLCYFTGTCPRIWLLPRHSSPTPQTTL